MTNNTHDEIEAELKANIKAAQDQAKAEKKRCKAANVLSGAEEFVSQHPQLFFVARQNYYVEKCDGQWCFFKTEALKKLYPLLNDKGFRDAVDLLMEEAGRCFYDCTYSFSDRPGILNLLDMSDWIKPKPGKYHWIFDVLIQAMGSDKPENVEHIKQVLTYKYLHPHLSPHFKPPRKVR